MNLMQAVQDVFKRCEAQAGRQKPYRFCFYGYTDIMLADAEWLALMPLEKHKLLIDRPNSKKLREVHGRPDVNIVPTLPSIAHALFDGQVVIDVLDFQTYEGSEIVADLNYKIAASLEQNYDAVFDNGTSEHVFNYPQVLMNSHLLTKPGGFIMHGVPVNWPNHGFYSLSPTIFYDFYEDNAATTLLCEGYFLKRDAGRVSYITINDLPKWQRFTTAALAGAEISVMYMVQKQRHITDFTFPIQRKYRGDKSTWV